MLDSPPPSRSPADESRRRWEPPTPEELARILPQYEITSLLGVGGMGAVYRGTQVTLGRSVAVKLLPAEVSATPESSARFIREARAMARLNHPHIASVFDFGQTAEGQLYFIMEYVDGANLQQLIRSRQLSLAQALQIVEQICDALEYAHEEGVIHRDIKPSNVLVDRRGRVKVADFGLARMRSADEEDASQITQSGVVLGTPAYMAPEQKHGMPVDHRADIYSLGILLYEALTGRLPQGVFTPPSQRVEVDRSVDEIVARALQEEPEARFPSSAVMKRALNAVPRGAGVNKGRERSGKDPAAAARRTRVRRWMTAVGCFAVLLGAGVWFGLSRDAPRDDAPERAIVAAASMDAGEQNLDAVAKPAADSPPPAAIEAAPSIKSPTSQAMPTAIESPATAAPSTAAADAKPASPPEGQPPRTEWPATAAGTSVAAVSKAPEPPPVDDPATPAKVSPEVEKWFAEIKAPYQKAYETQAVEPWVRGVQTARGSYTYWLSENMKRTSKPNQWRTELNYFMAVGQVIRPDDPLPPDEVRFLRSSFQDLVQKAKEQRQASTKTLLQRFDGFLQPNINQLRANQREADAAYVEAQRDELRKAWSAPFDLPPAQPQQ